MDAQRVWAIQGAADRRVHLRGRRRGVQVVASRGREQRSFTGRRPAERAQRIDPASHLRPLAAEEQDH